MEIAQLKNIALHIIKYTNLLNNPNIKNNIEIKNNNIYLIKDSKIILQQKIDLNKLKSNLQNIYYQKNIFNNYETRYSPFEADRQINKDIWKNTYNRINFPKFMPIALMTLLLTKELPSLIDFIKIYMLSYMELISEKEQTNERFLLYKEKINNDRTRLGQTIIFADGQKINNKLLRFRKEFSPYIYNLPINEFTTEHLCNRIHKVYGSIIRDIYNALYFYKYNIYTYYNLLDDYLGIDLFLNGIPVYAYTNTFGGQEFRDKKIHERHPNLNKNIGIKLEKEIYKEKLNGLYLIKDEDILKIKNILNKGINSFVKISF